MEISRVSIGGPSPMLLFFGLIGAAFLIVLVLFFQGHRDAAKAMLNLSAGFVLMAFLFSFICPWQIIRTTYGKGMFEFQRTSDSAVTVTVPSSGDTATWTDAATYNRIDSLEAVVVEHAYTIWGKETIGGSIAIQFDQNEKKGKE